MSRDQKSQPAAQGTASEGTDRAAAVASLRNFGRSFAATEPQGWAKVRILRRAVAAMRRQLGLAAVVRLLWRARRLQRRVDRDVLARLGDQGLDDGAFVAARVEETALAAALVERVGLERAEAVYRQVLEEVAGDVMRELVPTAAELARFDDPFGAFRDYLEAVIEANAAAGIHLAEVREDSDGAYAYDVTYCAYERVGAAFGDPRLCAISSCAGDEVTFPRLCSAIGARFVRQSTLAAGARCCDFRFERVG